MTQAEAERPGGETDVGMRPGYAPLRPGTHSRDSDPLIAALARYVEVLHRRYPDGPEQMRREGLDGRATITAMLDRRKGTAA